MYERFYNLRERPFSLSPDPDYLYPSRVHKEALSYLRYGIESHAGFIVITGEIGSGKTTLLQTVLRGLDHQTSVARLVSTTLHARELIEAVMLDFGLDPGQARSKPYLIRDFARYLVEQRAAGRLALLVIDEAQNLSLPALEEVRMLSNLETEKSKLIQIALIGQPNLRDVLARPELEQLRQRVTVSYHLQALDAPETSAYVNHRLRRAAIGAPLEFPRDVTDLIHEHSRGIPRKINVIADAILLFGYGEEQRTVTVDLTRQVLEELESTGVITAPPAGTVPVVAPAVALAVAPAIAPAVAPPDEAMAAREARITERERHLAERERLLIEGYRLLRQRRDSASPATAMPAPAATTMPAPAATTIPVPAAMTMPAAVATAVPTATAMPALAATAIPAAAATVALTAARAQAAPTRPPATAVSIYQAPAAPREPARAAGRILFAPSPNARSRGASDSGGIWARLRRGLFGLAKPVFED
jgi:general secretion pathway protein A